MGQSKVSLVLVYAVDQMLDFYEVNSRPMPSEISIDSATYKALCEYKNDKTLTHYRGVALKQVNKNTKT